MCIYRNLEFTTLGQEVETNDSLRRGVLGLTDNMEDIFTTNQQKAFKYAKMKLERMDQLGNQVIEILPQTYLHCYKLCLALGEQEIAEIFAVKGKNVAKLIRGNNSLWSQIKWEINIYFMLNPSGSEGEVRMFLHYTVRILY